MHRLLISPFHDPYLNLALEGHFLEILSPDEEILFLYTNTPAVVIGRFQNPWKECCPSELQQTALVRRESGGGTVYHDSGNLNFSFIQHNEDYNRIRNLETVRKIMTPWDIPLHINDRHDLVVSQKGREYKVSGSAFRHKKDRAFHHGTLLIDCRTEKLKASISPGGQRIFLQSSGTSSKRSPVINLKTIRSTMTMDKVMETFRSYYRNLDSGRLDEPAAETWEALAEEMKVKAQELRSDPWIYGKTPPFVLDLSALSPPVSEGWNMRVEKGVIRETPACLEKLKGQSYGRGISENMLREKLPGSLISGTAGNEFLSRLLSLIA